MVKLTACVRHFRYIVSTAQLWILHNAVLSLFTYQSLRHFELNTLGIFQVINVRVSVLNTN